MNYEMTDAQANRLVEWLLEHGHSKEEAYEALAYVMHVTANKKVTPQPDKLR